VPANSQGYCRLPILWASAISSGDFLATFTRISRQCELCPSEIRLLEPGSHDNDNLLSSLGEGMLAMEIYDLLFGKVMVFLFGMVESRVLSLVVDVSFHNVSFHFVQG
jgi:hypothetical protein